MEDNKRIELNKQEFILRLTRKEEGYFQIEAWHNENVVGSTIFKLKKGECYLYRIEILDTNFAHIGLGTQMLRFMEQIAYKGNCYSIDGKFYPFGELGAYAKDFYIKNGYSVDKEYYETFISKRLTKNSTIELEGNEWKI